MKTHTLTVRAVAGQVQIVCSVGDLNKNLGHEVSPDAIAKVANEHWGHPVGWLS